MTDAQLHRKLNPIYIFNSKGMLIGKKVMKIKNYNTNSLRTQIKQFNQKNYD